MFSSQCPRACHVIISFSFSSSTKLLKVPKKLPVHWTARHYSKWRICSSVYVLCLKKKVPLLSQTAVLITWCSHKKFLVRTILNGYLRETNFGHGISFRIFILIRKFEKSLMHHSYRHTQGDLRF